MLLMSVSTFAQSNETLLRGDVNGDGVVDVADITAVIGIIKNVQEHYFYLGTVKPTAENYKIIPGTTTSYTSFDEAVGMTVSVDAGQTLYMLCPAQWVMGKTVVLEDNSGETLNFSQEIDCTTVSGYAIYKTQVLTDAKDVTLKGLTACSSSDNGDGGNTVDWSSTTNGMVSSTFSGFVKDIDEVPLRGVTVTSGDQTATTDLNGYYKLDKVNAVKGRVVVKFQKQGYMTVVRSLPGQNNARLDMNMKECTTKTFSASTATAVVMYGSSSQMTVYLPADGYVTESGAAYSGLVTAQAVYLNPDDDNFSDQMPGDLSALRTDNSEAQLVSYGMLAVELTDASGNKLQLAEGKTATVAFPVPDKFKGGELPATIPLWSFDEATGLWVEEGVATYVATLKAYIGGVSHFSWHNLDQPELRATLSVKVQDANGNPVPHIIVNVDGQRTPRTNNDGIATCIVPSNTPMAIWVPSESYGNYADVYTPYDLEHPEYGGYWILDDAKIVMQQNVTLAPQQKMTITLTMPNMLPTISGKVTNEGTGSQLCIVWVQYGNAETAHFITDKDGNFSLLAPANYTGPATLYAQYGDGYQVSKQFDITGENVVVNLTANTSSTATPFLLRAIGDGLNLAYQLPDPDDECWNAVSVSGKGLNLNAYIQNKNEWGGVNINIPDYDPANPQPSYTSTNNSFSYMKEGMGGWTQIQTEETGSALTINVSKSGDVYTFKITNADAKLIDPNKGFDWNNGAPVKISVEFSARAASEN